MRRAEFLQSLAAALVPVMQPLSAAPRAGQLPPALESVLTSGAMPTVYNVCDPEYGAVGDGQAYDDHGIAACFAAGQLACPEGAIYLLPAGKTFRVRKAVTPPPGAILFGFGATIMRMDQVSSAFSGSVTGGSTSVITGVTSTRGFQPGDQVTIFNGATIDPGFYTIAPSGAGASTVTLTSPVQSSMVGGILCSAFPTVYLQYDNQKIYGLTVDGNLARFRAFQYFSNLVEIESGIYTAVGIEITSCTVRNAPGEGIVFCATDSSCSNNTLTNIRGDGIHLSCKSSRIESNYLYHCDQHNSRHAPRGAITFSLLNTDVRVVGNRIARCYNGIAAADSPLKGKGGTGTVITDNHIHNATHYSLYFEASQGARANAMIWRGNRAYGPAPCRFDNLSPSASYPRGTRHFQIIDNYFEGPIAFTQIHDSTISGNTINLGTDDAVSVGLAITSSQNVDIADNEVAGGLVGIAVRHDELPAEPESHILIHDNRCIDNRAYGIDVRPGVAGPQIRVANNLCRSSEGTASPGWVGIAIYSPNDMQVSGNTVWTGSTHYAVGIYITGTGPDGSAVGSIVTNNHIRGCVVCILLDRGSRNHIVKYNQLAPHARGIAVRNASTGSIVAENERIR